MKKEITIVGGGIAGLSLGIALRRREIPVTLVESGSYPRHRVCGEFISGVSQETVATLGVDDLLKDAERCLTTSWHDGDGSFYSAELPAPAFGISRYRLDQRMAKRLREEGGNVREKERFRESGDPAEGTVFATGRPRNSESSWIGLKAHLAGFKLETDLEMHLGAGGYLGLSRVENGLVNACGLFQRQEGLRVSRETALKMYLEAIGLGALVDRMAEATIDPESHMAVNAFEFGRQEETISAVRVGDRHSIIGPFTGNGMSLAFESAETALPFLENFCEGRSPWSETVRESDEAVAALSRRRLAASKAFHPFLTKGAGRKILRVLGGQNLLPFRLLYRMVR